MRRTTDDMYRWLDRSRREDGFTLVELLVVIAILGILAGVVVFAVRGVDDKGRAAAVAIDERIIRTAEEAFHTQNGRYGTEDELVSGGFLTGPSQYHDVNPDPVDPARSYQVTCEGGTPEPCGQSDPTPTSTIGPTTTTSTILPTTTTSTTVPPTRTWVQTAPAPTSRYAPAMAGLPSANHIVLFGGQGPNVRPFAGDTWVWSSGAWTIASPEPAGGCQQPPVSGGSPCWRSGHGMAYDAANGQVVMVGGWLDAGERPRETWTWNGSAWSLAASGSGVPQSLFGATAYLPGRGVVLFGGSATDAAGNPVFSGATWTWNGATKTWTQAPVAGPSPRIGASMAYDPQSNRLILFGGADESGQRLGDTWAWDGTGWTALNPTSKPSPRDSAAMATMTSGTSGAAVLFGGLNPPTYFADTWLWDAAANTWRQQQPVTSPSGRFHHAMAPDPATGQPVAFGGEYVGGYPTDTWVYRPTTGLP